MPPISTFIPMVGILLLFPGIVLYILEKRRPVALVMITLGLIGIAVGLIFLFEYLFIPVS